MKFLQRKHQLKFVVNSIEDLEEVKGILKVLNGDRYFAGNYSLQNVYLMPQGISIKEITEREKWLQVEAEKMQVRYTDRYHIRKWGDKRGV